MLSISIGSRSLVPIGVISLVHDDINSETKAIITICRRKTSLFKILYFLL